MRAFINGRKVIMANAGTSITDAPCLAENDDISLASITKNEFFSISNDLHLVNYGVYKGNLTLYELAELHNNGHFSNPRNLTNWVCYYQFNKAGTAWSDLAGNCADAVASQPLQPVSLNALR